MKGDAHLTTKTCSVCGDEFFPKPMGYNAAYCSRSCKDKEQRKRKPDTAKKARKRSYQRIILDSDRYASHLEAGRKSVRRIRLWLAEYKLKSGCVDCGYRKHACALQLDHEGEKTANISDLRSSVARLMAEIESGKCVVRCANCHSVKTWAEKNKIPYTPNM